jgi:hypothetical protein
MRHASFAERPLPAAVPLASLWRALVSTAGFASAQAIAQLATAVAVPLSAVVAETDVETLAANEAGDLDEIELVRPRHRAGEADLDNGGARWDALSVTRSSFHLAASTRPAARPGAVGRSPPHPR